LPGDKKIFSSISPTAKFSRIETACLRLSQVFSAASGENLL
jgi:hypothetical protein